MIAKKKTLLEIMQEPKVLNNSTFEHSLIKQNKYSSLVRVINKTWKNMSLTERMLIIGEYLNATDTYNVFTLRLSKEKMAFLERIENKADFFRRLIQAHCFKKFRRCPICAFVLERCPKGYLHLHGVINYCGLPVNEIRDILKCAAFGANFRQYSMNRFILKVEPVKEGIGWLSYMLKSTKESRKYIYVSNQLKQCVKFYLREKNNDR